MRLGGGVGRRGAERAAAEKKVAILEKALGHHPGSDALLLALLEAVGGRAGRRAGGRAPPLLPCFSCERAGCCWLLLAHIFQMQVLVLSGCCIPWRSPSLPLLASPWPRPCGLKSRERVETALPLPLPRAHPPTLSLSWEGFAFTLPSLLSFFAAPSISALPAPACRPSRCARKGRWRGAGGGCWRGTVAALGSGGATCSTGDCGPAVQLTNCLVIT